MSQTKVKEKLLTSRNNKVINEKINTQKTTAKFFNEIIDTYQKLEIDELSLNDLAKLVKAETNLKDFVKSRMLKGRKMDMNVGGLKLSPSALASMIEMPDLRELEEALENFRHKHRYTAHQLDGLQIESGQVVVSSKWQEQVIEENCLYAECEKERELFITFSEICDRLNLLKDKYGFRNFVSGAHQHEIIFIHFDLEEKKFKVSANALKRHCKNAPAYVG